MPFQSKITSFWKNLFRKRQQEINIDDELSAYVDELTERKIRAGMDKARARREALVEIGGMDQLKERVRDRRVGFGFELWLRDVAYAWRGFGRTPGFVAVVVVLLALGIGANTALFSVIDAAVLRKLAVDNPDELALLGWTPRQGGVVVEFNEYSYRSAHPFSYPTFEAIRAHNETLSELFAIVPFKARVVVDRNTEEVEAQSVSGNYYRGLKERGVLGRMLVDADDVPGAEPVAIISYRYWQRRFGQNPAVVGSQIVIDGESFTIVGVTSQSFHGTGGFGHSPNITVPLIPDAVRKSPKRLTDSVTSWVYLMGRIKPGINLDQVKANLEPFVPQNTVKGGSFIEVVSGSRGADSLLLYLGAGIQGPIAVPLLVIAFCLLLLVGCVNVSNLLLARAASRQQEIGIRQALGASRLRLVRQLLTETVLLALMGGAAGTILAYWGKDLLWANLPGAEKLAADLIDFRIDVRVLGFTAAVSLLTGILFGIAPALRASRADLHSVMKRTADNSSLTRSRVSKLLLVLQVAACIVLVVSGGLFFRTLKNFISDYMAGVPVDNILQFRMDVPAPSYDAARLSLIRERLINEIQAIPGIVETTTTRGAVGLGGMDVVRVRPNFFTTMGIPIVAGQDLSSINGPDMARFAVINEALARRFFPNDNPIGKEVPQKQAVAPELEVLFPGIAQLMKEKRTIIGIAKDAASGGRVRGIGPAYFVADTENLPGPVTFGIRVNGNAGELIPKVSEAIRVVEPAMGTPVVQTIGQRITEFVATGFSTERALVVALNFLGGVGLLMVSVGLYGVTSYRVARRKNEIGIRMALGAQRRNIIWLAQKETLRIVAAGAIIGLLASIPLMLLIRRMIFGLASDDITTVLVVVALIIGVSAIATYLPARRAARVDPMLSLRVE